MPEGLDPKFWDPKTGVKTPDLIKSFQELSARDAAAAAKAATVPAKPEDYTLDLPKEFKAPDGFNLSINDKDPRLPMVRAFAKAHSLGQDGFSELLALDVQFKAAQLRQVTAQADAIHAAETKALGENGPQRLQSVTAFLEKHLTPKRFTALVGELSPDKKTRIGGFTTRADAVEAIEHLVSMATASGIPGQKNNETPNGPADKPIEQLFYPEQAAQQKKVV